MTSTPFTSGPRSTDGHPDVAEISALNEDLLPADRSSALQAHLAGCRLCADVLASLDEIQETLGTLPGPARMPADIAGRIDAALAAEALPHSSRREPSVVSRETGDAVAAFGEDGLYGRPASETSPAGHHRHAATVGSVSRETGATRRPNDRPAGRPGGGSGPGRHRPARRARRWRSAILAGAGAVVALGIGGLVMQSMNDPAPPPTAGGGHKDGRTIAGSALEKHVHGLLAEHESGQSSEGSSGTPSGDFNTKESTANSPLVGGATSIPSCVRAGIDRTEKPLAVDEDAPYKGRTAYLVVLPHRDDPKRVDAYVVDRSCVEGEGGGLGTLLTKHTYARR
ncbi:hypothetical protein HCC61_26250 [Streptomyces sp. HNM0575]|uniref:hypothetical protein n=1 Tax=Streptomyces sp. HNM0575 TaxID=2716338 RepID=UPI00145DD7C2|nr:hypothetical protein [Streptomyces sp. HNM0575]NLU76107.1 hypothetical protein [Streptomyces sp. HNM0575]